MRFIVLLILEEIGSVGRIRARSSTMGSSRRLRYLQSTTSTLGWCEHIVAWSFSAFYPRSVADSVVITRAGAQRL
jgi:hypothetical protein